MPDLDLISTTLAARYASAQVTPPAGYTNVRVSTANPPNAMLPLPCVIVFADNGDFRTGNGTRQGSHDFTVRFYFKEATDLARENVALRKWATVLVDQLKLSTQLGGIVTSARCMSWSMGQMKYGDQTFSGLELAVTVVTDESWAAVS